MLGSHGIYLPGVILPMKVMSIHWMSSSNVRRFWIQITIRKTCFGGPKINTSDHNKSIAAQIAPVLRGYCSSHRHMVGHFTDDARVLEFINSHDLEKLAPMGTSCPDHFLRTKISPLVLNLSATEDVSDVSAIKNKLLPQFDQYRKMYTDYYETCKHKTVLLCETLTRS